MIILNGVQNCRFYRGHVWTFALAVYSAGLSGLRREILPPINRNAIYVGNLGAQRAASLCWSVCLPREQQTQYQRDKHKMQDFMFTTDDTE